MSSEITAKREAAIAPASDYTALMAQAIEKGAEGVEMLERLVALQERVDDRNARKAYHAALARFQRTRAAVRRTRAAVDRGGKLLYKFADIDTITSAVGPALADCGLSYSFDSEEDGHGGVKVTCTLRHEDGHSESASFSSKPPERTPLPLSDAQRAGQAITYGRRYSLIQILGLTDSDEDARPPEPAVEPIDDKQAVKMTEMLEAIEAEGDDKFGPAVLSRAGAATIADFPASLYDAAMTGARNRLKKLRGGE